MKTNYVGNGTVTEEYVRWLSQQSEKVKAQEISCMTTEQALQVFNIGCRIFN